MFVMVSMMRGPPEDALLRGSHSKECYDKLQDSTRLECTMGKIAVIACGDGEHSHVIAGNGEYYPLPSSTCLQDEQSHQVDADKYEDTPIVRNIFCYRCLRL
jgi:hypothetical protein